MRVGETLRDALPDWCDPSDLGMIVQSACLAHDIGNPPFGHSGEDAIRHWFQQAAGRGWLDDMSDDERADFLNFEGNAQGFRVLTQLEYHQFDGGTRLTYATLGTYLKYPWTPATPTPWATRSTSSAATRANCRCSSRSPTSSACHNWKTNAGRGTRWCT
jgi:dGTP triphosphohydrolase